MISTLGASILYSLRRLSLHVPRRGIVFCGAGLLLVPAIGEPSARACIRPTRPGTQVQGEVKICPGRYRVPEGRDLAAHTG